MHQVLVDTGAWIALLNTREDLHPRAKLVNIHQYTEDVSVALYIGLNSKIIERDRITLLTAFSDESSDGFTGDRHRQQNQIAG